MTDRYITPFADYGFKKLFGTEENKDLLISLLNAIIDDNNDPIADLQYKNVEQIGDIIGTRTNYFDVYCQTLNGRHFIVEMQNTWKPFFKDHHVFYDKLTLIYIELPKILDIDLKLDNMRDRWMYALNHLYYYGNYPEELQEDVFKKLFEQGNNPAWTTIPSCNSQDSQKRNWLAVDNWQLTVC